MKPTVIHLIDQFGEGGADFGVLNLIDDGFYDGVDLHAIGLTRGYGPTYETFKNHPHIVSTSCLFPELDGALASPARMLPAPFLLAKEFARLKPQAAVLSLAVANIAGRLAALAFPSVKVVSFEHDIQHGRKMSLLLRLTAPRVDAIFADTPASARFASNMYGRCADDITKNYVPLVTLEAGQARTDVTDKPATFRIVSLGRLATQKNYAILIKAVAEMIKDGRDVTLKIAGEGPLRQELQDIIDQSKVGDRITMPGFISGDAAKKKLFESADAYALPTGHEGFCIAVAEALAAGLPTVATKVGGIGDYGVDGENILTMEAPPTVEKMIAALCRLMDNYAELAPKLSAGAIATAKQEFSKAAVLTQRNLAKPVLVTPVEDWRLLRLMPRFSR